MIITVSSKPSSVQCAKVLPTLAPAPAISGAPQVDRTLTAVPGAWSPAPVSLAYRCAVGGVVLAGAEGTTFQPRPVDAGTVAVAVTGTKAGYVPATKTSSPATPVAAGVFTADRSRLKRIRDEAVRGAQLGLKDDEVASYDAVAQDEAAVLELGDDTLKAIARDLVNAVRDSTTIGASCDALQSSSPADYPPDAEEKAFELVLEPAQPLPRKRPNREAHSHQAR